MRLRKKSDILFILLGLCCLFFAPVIILWLPFQYVFFEED